MTIQEINSTIMFGSLTNDQLNSVIDAVKFARAQLNKQKIRSFKVGDKVKFISARNGQLYLGDVRKIKIKYILVQTPGGLFNVPSNMLEVA